MASFTCAPSISGWRAFSPVVGYCKAAGQSDDFRVTVSLRVERQYEYFMSNIVFVVFLIVLLAPTTFAIDYNSMSDRMQIVLTLLLTVITFKFIIAGEVPKTATVTLLDKYMLLSFLMFLLVVFQTVVANLWDPKSFCSCGVCACSFDLWCALIMLAFWISFHVVFYYRAVSGSFYPRWEEMRDEGAVGPDTLLADPKDVELGPASSTSNQVTEEAK